MASNGGVNLQECLDKIRNNDIKIDPLVWDTLYLYIGDHLSAINLICSYYIEENQSIKVEDSRKILNYTKRMMDIIGKLSNHEKIQEEKEERLEKIKKENMVIHPLVKSLIDHYIRNDLNAINLIVSSYTMGNEPIILDHVKKIHDRSSSMSAFLDKLRKSTQRDVSF